MRPARAKPAPDTLPTAETSIGILLARLGQIADRHARATLAAHDFSPRQLRILDLLSKREVISQRELGQTMHIDTSTIVHLLNPMERAGLIARTRDAADRRRHVVSITPSGAEQLTHAGQAFKQIDEHLTEALHEPQREQLRYLLIKLLHAHLDETCDAADQHCPRRPSDREAGDP